MTNHIQTHEVNQNGITAKRELYTEMCLHTFLSGLKEPLGATIRAMNPSSLSAAFSCCIKEQNIAYISFRLHQQNPILFQSKPFTGTRDEYRYHQAPINHNQTNSPGQFPCRSYPLFSSKHTTPNLSRPGFHITT